MPLRKLDLKSGDRFPVQHREFKVDPARINKEARTVEILFSTDEPAERWYGNEILDHSPGSCDLSRLNDGGAFLKDHDSRLQIGVHESATIGIIQRGKTTRGEGRAVVRFAPASNPLAEQEWQDLLAGVRTKISVGYIAHEMQLTAEDDDSETWTVTKWEPLENSLVAIPLDAACAAGRAMPNEDEHPIKIVREVPKKTNVVDSDGKTTEKTTAARNKQNATRKNDMDPENETPEQKQARDLKEKTERDNSIKEGLKKTLERQKEIHAISKKATKKIPGDTLQKYLDSCVEDENAVEAFRKLVMDKYWGVDEDVETPAADGPSGIVVVGPRKSIGQIFVESESFKKAVTGRGQGRRESSVDMPIATVGIRGKLAMNAMVGGQRAFASSDLSAVNIAPQQQLVALGVQKLTVMDLIAPGTTSAAAIPYPRENTLGSVEGTAVSGNPRARSVGERGVKPTFEPDLTTQTANVKKIAILAKVPDEFMADFPGMQSYIDERLPYMVDMETEAQILYGDGLGNNLQGITSAPGIQTRVYATSWGDTALKALTDVRVGSFFEPDGFAFHPYDWENARLEKDLNGQYLAGGPYYVPYGNGVFAMIETFWGKPVVVTTSVTQGRPIAGAWRLGAQYFIREGMRLETSNSNKDDFERNMITIRAEHRLALATYRPVAFLEMTGGPART